MAPGFLETEARGSRTLWTPDLGQVVGTAPLARTGWQKHVKMTRDGEAS